MEELIEELIEEFAEEEIEAPGGPSGGGPRALNFRLEVVRFGGVGGVSVSSSPGFAVPTRGGALGETGLADMVKYSYAADNNKRESVCEMEREGEGSKQQTHGLTPHHRGCDAGQI